MSRTWTTSSVFLADLSQIPGVSVYVVCKIRRMRQICCFRRSSKKLKSFQLQGGSRPLTRSSAPGLRWGLRPQTHVRGSRSQYVSTPHFLRMASPLLHLSISTSTTGQDLTPSRTEPPLAYNLLYYCLYTVGHLTELCIVIVLFR